MLLRYLRLAGVEDFSREDFLFRPLTFLKSSNKHVLRGGKLSYSRCREVFKDALGFGRAKPTIFWFA